MGGNCDILQQPCHQKLWKRANGSHFNRISCLLFASSFIHRHTILSGLRLATVWTMVCWDTHIRGSASEIDSSHANFLVASRRGQALYRFLATSGFYNANCFGTVDSSRHISHCSPPRIKKRTNKRQREHQRFPVIIVTCESPHIALLALHIIYETVLIIGYPDDINALGIFTIRLPENFNESKYIAFSTFAVGVVWLVLIPTYFATDSNKQLQAATVVLTLMIMAYCIIACLLLSLLYFAIRSEKSTDTSIPSKETTSEFHPSNKQKEITSLWTTIIYDNNCASADVRHMLFHYFLASLFSYRCWYVVLAP